MGGRVSAPHAGSVLHAVWDLGAPSETFIVDRMRELDRIGWRAWVAATELREDATFEFPPERRVLVPGRRDFVKQRLLGLLRGQGRGLRPGWWLERPIARVRPTLIHAHFGWAARDALPAAKRHRLPLVAGFHGYDAMVFPHYGFGADVDSAGEPSPDPGSVYAELFEGAGAIIAVSHYLEGRLREVGCDREVRVIPSGISLEHFRYRGPRSEPRDYRLLFVGRLIPYKGLDVALRALAMLLSEVETASLEVIGDGPTRAENEQLAGELGIARHVRFRGACPHSDVARAMQNADVVVVPSRTTAAGQAESLGNVAKEALAVGLPVVASDSGGLPEVTPPARRHELVPENDPAALAIRLAVLWGGRDEWPARCGQDRRWVEESFDWRLLAPRLAEVYRDSIAAERR
jgi:colanic acid/amylovoran biosynthesis glycosyltransferase